VGYGVMVVGDVWKWGAKRDGGGGGGGLVRKRWGLLRKRWIMGSW